MNQLKNHKKVPIQFDFDFQNLKPIESNQTKRTEPIQLGQHLKKKNRYK
jgi:hypothetical protein